MKFLFVGQFLMNFVRLFRFFKVTQLDKTLTKRSGIFKNEQCS